MPEDVTEKPDQGQEVTRQMTSTEAFCLLVWEASVRASDAITSIRDKDAGGRGTLYVDRPPCGFCANSMAGLSRSIGLDSLDVYTPEGLFGNYSAETSRFLRAS